MAPRGLLHSLTVSPGLDARPDPVIPLATLPCDAHNAPPMVPGRARCLCREVRSPCARAADWIPNRALIGMNIPIRRGEPPMCASYGLDPRFDDAEYQAVVDAAVLEGLRSWAVGNDGEILRPTGKNLRNLNPILTGISDWELAWWGYLVNGAPTSFASINTRSERLASGKGSLPDRAIVPVSFWREMAKPSRAWHHFTAPANGLLGLAAITRPGRTADGAEFTCYSIVMQPAAPHLQHIHDRMPLLINPGFAEEWLTAPNPGGALVDAAIAAAVPINERIRVVPDEGGKATADSDQLF